MDHTEFSKQLSVLNELTEQQLEVNRAFEEARLLEFARLAEIVGENPNLVTFYANALKRLTLLKDAADLLNKTDHSEQASKLEQISSNYPSEAELRIFFELFVPREEQSELTFTAVSIDDSSREELTNFPTDIDTEGINDSESNQKNGEVKLLAEEEVSDLNENPDDERNQDEKITYQAEKTENLSVVNNDVDIEQPEAKDQEIDVSLATRHYLEELLNEFKNNQQVRGETFNKQFMNSNESLVFGEYKPSEYFRLQINLFDKWLEKLELPLIQRTGQARGTRYQLPLSSITALEKVLAEAFGDLIQATEEVQDTSQSHIETNGEEIAEKVQQESKENTELPVEKDEIELGHKAEVKSVLRLDGVWMGNKREYSFNPTEVKIIEILSNVPRKEPVTAGFIYEQIVIHSPNSSRITRNQVDQALRVLIDLPYGIIFSNPIKGGAKGYRLYSGQRPKKNRSIK